MTMNKSAIQFSDVSLSYGTSDNRVEVLKGISFSINTDEIVSIVEPSG